MLCKMTLKSVTKDYSNSILCHISVQCIKYAIYIYTKVHLVIPVVYYFETFNGNQPK